MTSTCTSGVYNNVYVIDNQITLNNGVNAVTGYITFRYTIGNKNYFSVYNGATTDGYTLNGNGGFGTSIRINANQNLVREQHNQR